MSLSHDPPIGAAKDIIEGAAVTYWGAKVAKGDVDPQTKGVNVRSHAEYTAVAVGQATAVGIGFRIFGRILLTPFIIASLFVIIALPMMLLTKYDPSSNSDVYLVPAVIYYLLPFVLFAIWAYVFAWRLFLRPLLRLIFDHGPSIHFADDYKGPLGMGNPRL